MANSENMPDEKLFCLEKILDLILKDRHTLSILYTLYKLLLFIGITADACLTRNSYVFRVHLLLLFTGAVCWDQQSSSFSGHLFQTNQPFPVWLLLLSWVMWPYRRHFNVGHHSIVWWCLADDSMPDLGKAIFEFPENSDWQPDPPVHLIHTRCIMFWGEICRQWSELHMNSKQICNLKEKRDSCLKTLKN